METNPVTLENNKVEVPDNFPKWTHRLLPEDKKKLLESAEQAVKEGYNGTPPRNPFDTVGTFYEGIYRDIPEVKEKFLKIKEFFGEEDPRTEKLRSLMCLGLLHRHLDLKKEPENISPDLLSHLRGVLEWRINTLTNWGILTPQVLERFLLNRNPNSQELDEFLLQFNQLSNEVLFLYLENKIDDLKLSNILKDIGVVDLGIIFFDLTRRQIFTRENK